MSYYEALHLDPDEHVILEVRKHWIVFATQAVVLFMAAIFPVLILQLVHTLAPVLLDFSFPGNLNAFGLFFYSLWLLFAWISFFISWTKYYLDVWYVTEKRIILIDQKKIFDREISNLRFDKIQDITVDVKGFIPTFLCFGDIKVQTASEDNSDFDMKTVRHPEEVRKVIFGRHNEVGDKE